jgi:enamine deaminase RidA (YjgF/YER057c/UK114 family)
LSTQVIHSENASKSIGIYSQAIKSGQIPLEQITMEVPRGNFLDQAQAVFENLWATIKESVGSRRCGKPHRISH